MSDVGAVSYSDARFRVGRVLQETFGVIGRNAVSVFLLSFVITVTTTVASYLAGRALALAPVSNPLAAGALGSLAGFLIGLVMHGILAAALTLIAINDLNGQRTGLGPALRVAFGMLLPVMVLNLIFALGIGIGTVLLIVPGLMLLARWFVIVPARVAEGTGIGGALSRSAALTKGHRWRVFALVLIYVLAAGMLSSGMFVYAGGPVQMAQLQAAFDPGFLAVQVVVSSISAAIYSSLVAACYVELRRTKEGALPNELAAVFE